MSTPLSQGNSPANLPPFLPQEITKEPIEKEAGCAPEPVNLL